jgi:bifunctional non-homologous end joining protein LigD
VSRDRLAAYRRKRDFEATSEPAGEAGASEELPRFVVQEHHATRLHWDLRLEHDGALASWAIPNGIPEDPQQNRKAVRTEDHPLEYLEFHGEIPKGNYGAGRMTIWDRGTYELHKWEERKVEITFHGARLQGRYGLFAAGQEPKDWMIHRMDPPADAAAEPMPDQIAPMLATAGPLPGEDGRWGFEIKWDGVRAIAHSEPGRLRFHSRNLNDITARYPELSRLNRALSSHRAILDGEIVAFEENGSHPPRPSFAALQGRMHLTSEAQVRRLARANPVSYVIFDLLWLDGHSLLREPYERRRSLLDGLGLPGERWQAPEFVAGHGEQVLAASVAQGLEGIVAKRLDSPYDPGRRSRAWIKVKNVRREDVVIGGWMPGEGRRRDRIGALLVGLPDGGGGLTYGGRVGTGFTEAELDRLAVALGALETASSPFAGGGVPKGAVFVVPTLRCEVEFVEWTKDGKLRAPSYKGLIAGSGPVMATAKKVPGSKDKAVEVEVDGRSVRVSNPTKVLYPKTGFTKADLVDYFSSIAPTLLPHLEGRMLTLKRYPDGVEGDHFYEKQCPRHRPEWVTTEKVRLERKSIEFCTVGDTATLVWLANLADIELHTSLALARSQDRPTMMVFDLDPGAPADIVQCCEVGLWLNGMFENLGLQCFPKTSGSKGLQIYVPLNTDVGYDDTKPFSRSVAELLEAEAPEEVVSRQRKELRGGKVLVDWSQNDEHKTTVNVYSTRANERPTVSTPVTWDEVRACHEAGDARLLTFTTEDVLRRVTSEGDLFAPVLSLSQRLPRL